MKRLPRSFYLRPTLEVAPELLGKLLVYDSPQGKLVGEINEVEAYIGKIDPAAHSYHGKTERTAVMFGEGGYSYIYFIYGMYFCLNIVTEPAAEPAAVLIRSVIPQAGTQIMAQNRHQKLEHLSPRQILALTNGPGKLCQAFDLSRDQNEIDMVNSEVLFVEDQGRVINEIKTSSRIGITKATELLWRFYY